MSAHVYYCETELLPAAASALILGILSDAERARHARLVRPHDRRDYVAAHALLRLALSAHTGQAPDALAFAIAPSGQPSLLAGEHASRTPPSFSLSHSSGAVACVVATDGPAGIDVERVNVEADTDAVAERYFAEDETAALRLGPYDPSRFYEIWTLKEALFKALGGGLSLPLRSASFRLDGSRVSLVQRPPLPDRPWTFLQMSLAQHALAAAIGVDGADLPPIEVIEVDPLALAGGRLEGTAADLREARRGGVV